MKFFEDNFRPVHISKLGDSDGFLTGYYEPIIEGSRVPTGEFTAPLYRRPPNLVASGCRKLGKDAFPSKGAKVGRRVGRRKIVPYYTRAEIEDGALDGWHVEICWLRSEIDVLFAQIQGSARIRLEDGSVLRINYNSHNGWPYMPVGRVLIERKIVTRDEVSMQRIRDWMAANADMAKDVRRQNKSYVFFRITDLATEDEAIGAQGVPLVPGRSIAVDRSLHAYGTPFFISADLPIANDKGGNEIPPLDVRAGYGVGHCWPRARRYLFRSGRRGRAHGGSHPQCRPIHDAAFRASSIPSRRAYVPLPPERGGFFAQLTSGSMIDPTAEDVPLPEPRPAAALEPDPVAKIEIESAAAAMSRRRSLSDEDHALWPASYVRSSL